MGSVSKIINGFLQLLSNFSGKFMEIISSKALGNYSASIRSYNFSNCLPENPKTLISMISGFFDVSFLPQTNYVYLWRHQNPPNDSRKVPNRF